MTNYFISIIYYIVKNQKSKQKKAAICIFGFIFSTYFLLSSRFLYSRGSFRADVSVFSAFSLRECFYFVNFNRFCGSQPPNFAAIAIAVFIPSTAALIMPPA